MEKQNAPTFKIVSRTFDGIVDYTNNVMYVLPNKPWKSNSVLKFLHLFSESIFSISNIEVTNNIVRMKKLIDEIEEKKINARFVDFSMTMFLPVLAIVKYNVMLPEH